MGNEKKSGSRKTTFDSIERAVSEIAAGKMVIVVDDEDRENEGDLTCAAEKITPEIVNFMARFGRGLICIALERSRCEALDLPLMVENNTSANETAFCISVEAREGTTTGISAHDRAATVRALVDPTTRHAILSIEGSKEEGVPAVQFMYELMNLSAIGVEFEQDVMNPHIFISREPLSVGSQTLKVEVMGVNYDPIDHPEDVAEVDVDVEIDNSAQAFHDLHGEQGVHKTHVVTDVIQVLEGLFKQARIGEQSFG